MDEIQKLQGREYMVRKANELIQRASNTLNYNEQKVLCYLISMIKPGDEPTTIYQFSINDYCEICGINKNDGRTRNAVKGALLSLGMPFFIDENGKDVMTKWVSEAEIDRGGTIFITFHKLIHKYLFGVESNYTQYHLLSILPMRSTYSIKIYEMLKSYSGFIKSGTHNKDFELDELKRLLGVIRVINPKTKEEKDTYKNFKDFRIKVLEVAQEEINLYTDLTISWETVTKGRKVIGIVFKLSKKKNFDKIYTQLQNNAKLEKKQ